MSISTLERNTIGVPIMEKNIKPNNLREADSHAINQNGINAIEALMNDQIIQEMLERLAKC